MAWDMLLAFAAGGGFGVIVMALIIGARDEDDRYSEGWHDGFIVGRDAIRSHAPRANAGAAQRATEAEVEIVGRIRGSA